MHITKSLLVCINILLHSSVLPKTLAYKCCTPNQWEGQIFVDHEQVLFTSHMNVTATVAYDYTNSIAFVNASGMVYSPKYSPKPQFESVLYVEDYTNKIEYEVDNGNICEKTAMQEPVMMIRQCIQDGDKFLYSGTVGNGIISDTYNVSLSDVYDNVRATMQRDTCLPIHLVYMISKFAGSMTEVDVFNLTPGIKDRRIFLKPPQCKNIILKQRKRKEDIHPLKMIVKELFIKRLLFGKI